MAEAISPELPQAQAEPNCPAQLEERDASPEAPDVLYRKTCSEKPRPEQSITKLRFCRCRSRRHVCAPASYLDCVSSSQSSRYVPRRMP